jgi:predicted RNA-binding protein YlqC (UPF0109 family)
MRELSKRGNLVLGVVIGRNGRTAKALRTVVSALAGRTVRVDLIDTDEVR